MDMDQQSQTTEEPWPNIQAMLIQTQPQDSQTPMPQIQDSKQCMNKTNNKLQAKKDNINMSIDWFVLFF